MADELPKAVYSSTLNIMGVELVVHVLDNGQRVIESAGVEALFEAMASGAPMSDDEAMKLAKVIRVS